MESLYWIVDEWVLYDNSGLDPWRFEEGATMSDDSDLCSADGVSARESGYNWIADVDAALRMAVKQAHLIAHQTGTGVVVRRDGVLSVIAPLDTTGARGCSSRSRTASHAVAHESRGSLHDAEILKASSMPPIRPAVRGYKVGLRSTRLKFRPRRGGVLRCVMLQGRAAQHQVQIAGGVAASAGRLASALNTKASASLFEAK